MRNVRVRQNRVSSFIGMIMAGIFFIIGISKFMSFGFFGIMWTFICLVGVFVNAYNAFSEKGIAVYTISEDQEADYKAKTIVPQSSFEENMRQINALKNDGLITEEEFQEKRKEIMARRL